MGAYEHMTITEAKAGVALTDEQAVTMAMHYEGHRDNEDGPILVGLYGEDLVAATRDLGTIMVRYSVESQEEPVYSPLLVPTENMEWYNMPFLRERFGEDTPLYCYVHPPVPNDQTSKNVVAGAVRHVLDEGAVVLFEQYRGHSPLDSNNWVPQDIQGQSEDGVAHFQNDGQTYDLEAMSTAKVEKRSDIFVGEVNFHDIDTVSARSAIFDVYKEAVEAGEIDEDPQNGPILEQVMTEDDAQRVWDIYEKPFERLSKGNPVLAGFDEESLKALMLNPDVIKIVNRVEGEITTVGIFTQKFEHCPWFNGEYFKREYPEYYETGNILMCPSIVTDESRRGAVYSWSLVKRLAETLVKRGSNILLAFECTEISTRYIPEKVVKRGAQASGAAEVTGFDNPTAVIEYKALRKTSD
jgi:hypothetical protein